MDGPKEIVVQWASSEGTTESVANKKWNSTGTSRRMENLVFHGSSLDQLKQRLNVDNESWTQLRGNWTQTYRTEGDRQTTLCARCGLHGHAQYNHVRCPVKF